MNPSEKIDKYIKDLNDWRSEVLNKIRKLILETDPEIKEEWKWMGSPCWYHNGLVCLANAHKDKVKVTFYHGASLADPEKIFNNGLGGNKWRAIDIYQNDDINEEAWKQMIKKAAKYNIDNLKNKKK